MIKDLFTARDGERWQQCNGGLTCRPRWPEEAMMKLGFLVEEMRGGLSLGKSKAASDCSRVGKWLWSLAK